MFTEPMLTRLGETLTKCSLRGGMPYRWDWKKHRICIPLHRIDTFRWIFSTTCYLAHTIFSIYRVYAVEHSLLDSVARIRAYAIVGLFILYSLFHIFYSLRRTQAALIVNAFIYLFELMEG